MNLKDIKELLNKATHRKTIGRGWTIEQFYLQFRFQNECCAICGRHQSKLDKLMTIDHDHKTGEDRGLLCHGCNIELGYYEKLRQLDFEKYLRTIPQRMKQLNNFNILNKLVINSENKKEIIRALRKELKRLEAQ